MCCQIVHQVGRLLHIMACSHLGIAFFLTGTPEPAADIHKKRGCQYFLMLEITPKHRMVELEIPNHYGPHGSPVFLPVAESLKNPPV